MREAVNRGSPVNRAHPLNRRLVAWLLVVPGTPRGGQWVDLAGPHHATLAGTTWQSSRARPGGWGSLDFTGTSTATLGSAASLDDIDAQGGGGMTVAFWAYLDTSASNSILVAKGAATAGAWEVRVLSNTNKTLRFLKDGNGGDVTSTSANGAFALGGWFHYCATWDGGVLGAGVTQYFDAVATTPSATSDAGTLKTDAANDLVFGTSADGRLDDFRLYNRVLAADEVLALYRASRLGYPGVLNRVRRSGLDAPAAPGGDTSIPFKPYRGRPTQLLGGALRA